MIERLLLLLLMLAAPNAASGQLTADSLAASPTDTVANVPIDTLGDSKATAFSFYFENDALYGGTDQYYTNGVQALWSRYSKLADDIPRIPPIPCSSINPPGPEPCGIYMIGAGQTMHTPASITETDYDPADRPYVGWTYIIAGAGSAWGDSYLDGWHFAAVELQGGILGPGAGAKATQSMAHWSFAPASRQPQGWSNQLPNQFGGSANLYYMFVRESGFSLLGVDFDTEMSPRWALHAGNILNAAKAGAKARVGQNMPPEYGFAGIPVRAGGPSRDSWLRGLWWDLSAELIGRSVISNVLIEGTPSNEMITGNRVELESFGSEYAFSVTVGLQPFVNLTYKRVVRSPEFSTTGGEGARHKFGIVILTLTDL